MDMRAELERRRHEADRRKLIAKLRRMHEENKQGVKLATIDEWGPVTVEFVPLRDRPEPPICRVRRMLKHALRACGLRAVVIKGTPKEG